MEHLPPGAGRVGVRGGPVAPVSCDGMPEVGEGRTDLVQVSRFEEDLDQGRRPERLGDAPAQPRESSASASRIVPRVDHPDVRRPMTRHDESDLLAALPLEPSEYDGPVQLLHPVLREGGAQLAPAVLCRGEDDDAGGVDVEPVDDAAPEAAFADPLDGGAMRDDRTQKGSAFS